MSARAATAPQSRMTARPERRAPTRPARLLDAEGFGSAVGEDTDQLFIEEIRAGPHVLRDPLVVHLPAPVDVFLEPFVEIAVLPALHDRSLVVELDLGNEELGEPPGLLAALVPVGRSQGSRE